MPICSYLVFPEPGSCDDLAARLAALPGCEVVRAENRDVLLLVTDTPDRRAEAALRASIERLDGLRALVLTFGEIEPPSGGSGAGQGPPHGSPAPQAP